MEEHHVTHEHHMPEAHEHDAHHKSHENISPKNAYLIPMSIIMAGVIIAGSVIYTGKGGRAGLPDFGGSAAVGQEGDPTADVKDLKSLADNDPVLGNASAPVTIVEFADFQCPFCGRFHKLTFPQIMEKYIKTGKVKFVYRDFAFLGKESEYAAQAADCANDQGKFWQYHDYIYVHQNGENEGAFVKDNLKGFAKTLGLDTAKFNQCLDSGKHAAEVAKDTADGRNAGVTGTPATFVNGHMIQGAVPFETFAAAIEDALKATK